MDEVVAYKAWAVGFVFAGLFFLERTYPASASVAHELRRITRNLAFWPLNLLLSVFVVLPVSRLAADHALWAAPDMPARIIFDLIVLDVFLYWWHRAMHEVPLLWRFHKVHHLDRHLDTTSAIRFHPGEIFLSVFARALVIMLLAIPFTSVVVFEALVLVAAFFHHSNWRLIKKIERPLAVVFVTPSFHWVHHHAKRADTDANYGTLFSFWDSLFKSKSPTHRTPNMNIGVEGRKGIPLNDRAFPVLLKIPFRRR